MGFSTPVLDSPASGAAKRARAVRTSYPLRETFRPTLAGDRRGLRPGVAGVLKRSPLAYAAFILMGLIVLGAIFAPLMSPYQKDKIDLTRQYLPPSLDHPFGTDDLGRDIFVRVMHGGRISLAVGFLAMFVALLIGVTAGGVAGYYGGWIDGVIMRSVDLMLAVPSFFVILFISSAITPKVSIVGLCLMIGFTQWMEVTRLVRAVVMTTKEHEFVDAARTIGLADSRIIVRHLLPHTTAPVLVAITLGLAQAIIIESGISFLGFGVQPPTPSWGAMLQDAQSYLGDCPWIAVFPGLMICLTVVCCTVLADFLGEATGPGRSSLS